MTACAFRYVFTWAGVIAPYFCISRAAAPATCGAAMLVPWLMMWLRSLRSADTLGLAGQLIVASNVRAEPTPKPGAAMSGFCAPLRDGPGLENEAIAPNVGGVLYETDRPPQSVQLALVANAAVVMTSVALPGSLTRWSFVFLRVKVVVPAPL